MPEISPKLFEKLVELKGWHPYIKSTTMTLSPRSKAKYVMAFKESTFTSEMPMARGSKLLYGGKGK